VRRAGAAAAVVALLGLAGCASLAPAPGPAPASDDAGALRLLEALRGEARVRRALRGVARMAVDNERGPLRASYALVVERPSRLRVEVRGLFGETLGVLVTDGGAYDWFRAEDGTRESGPVYDGLLFDVAGVPLTPRETVELLLGVPVPEPGLVLRGSARLPDGAVVAELSDGAGSSGQRFEFDPDGRLRRVETHAGESGVVWDARFDAYSEVRGSAFAHELALAFPAFETSARVRMLEVELNPELTPDVFVLKVPGG
jgi:hypothetical protein